MKEFEKYTTPKSFSKYIVEGELVVDHKDYKIWDNYDLRNMTMSNVVLLPGKQTYSHRHPFNDEIYIFHSGTGHMTFKEKNGVEVARVDVEAGTVVPVNGKWEHQTFNTGDTDLHFTMIYDNIGRPEGIEENTKGAEEHKGD